VEGSDLPARLQRARRDELVVEAADGEPIGRVDALYYDLDTGRPAWIGVRAEAEPNLRTLVPVEGSRATGEVVRVAFSRAMVEAAPRVDAERIDAATVRRLADHFALPRSFDERETAVLTPIVRHEEALSVAKERAETGRVRVRKWVEREPVTVEVALEHETVRVVREPIGRPAAEGAELGEAEISVAVYAERPVVEKRVVAVERIRLEKGVELDEISIEEELRVERIGAENGIET
jgi:uncharacterized protein (TIGR02271 family)